MRAQIVAYVILIYVALVQSLLHQNHIRVTYVGTSNFIMELVRFVPLFFVAMPQSVIIVIEVMFESSTLVDIVDGVKFKPQTPRAT
jgi:hypothetical protein